MDIDGHPPIPLDQNMVFHLGSFSGPELLGLFSGPSDVFLDFLRGMGF
jgi:hypothetical protein